MKEKDYPNNIAVVRRMRNLSQAYVAEQIGVSRPKYINIEKGTSELTVSQLKKLKKVLDADLEDLLGIDTGKFDYKKFLQKDNKNSSVKPMEAEASSLKLFEDKLVRSVWDEKEEKWWFSVVDVVGILAESDKPRDYWYRLKKRASDDEKIQLSTICRQLKMMSGDGKMYNTEVADTEGILRIIQSIPSKKAEPFKRWLAKVGRERIDQMVDPELSIEQALKDYKRLGYPDSWINQMPRKK